MQRKGAEDLRKRDVPSWREDLFTVEGDLEALLKEDEIYWKQRSREDLIKWGS